MVKCHHNRRPVVRIRVGREGDDEAASSKRRYSRPQLEKSDLPSVVTGGPSGKVEKHLHQGHKRL